jgi:hypothetical protein
MVKTLGRLLPILLASVAMPAQAAVPASALIEGTLGTGGGPAADGPYSVTLALYKDAQGGTALWSEKANITLKNGQFSHILGSVTPVNPAVLASAAYFGVAVAQDPELARKPLHSVLYAQRAGVAELLACSGCITAGHLEAGLASSLGEFTKKSELSDVATTGAYADLVGAPNMALYVKASELKKVATTGSYNDLTDKPVLPVLGKSCGTGLVVAGLKADGSLECVAGGGSASLPADGIDEISNNLIFNQFVDKVAGVKDMQIKDGFAAGSTDTIAFPSVGLAQKIWVELDLVNSDLSKIAIELYAPGKSTPYKLYAGGKTGTSLVAKYNDDTPLLDGDMNKDWLGKDITGNWTMIVKDTAALTVPPGTPPFEFDGKFNWSINLQTLSSKKIQIKGNLIVDGGITVGGKDPFANSGGATFRYARMSMHDPGWDWVKGNDPGFFLGVNPSSWSGNAVASSISADKDLWRMVFNYSGKNRIGGVLWNEYQSIYSNSSAGHFVFFLFRIKNSTGAAINWAPQYWYTSYHSWGDWSSATVNGANTWNSSGQDCYPGACAATPTFSIPANRTNSVIFAIAAGPTWCPNSQCHRSLYLAFAKGALTLPNGLEFVDDLDAAASGWDK